MSILGQQIGENWGFSSLKFLGGMYEHPIGVLWGVHMIGHNQFQNILHHVAEFRKNGPGT